MAEILRIELSPPSAEEFKRQFLKVGRARMIIFYQNGKAEERLWIRQNFSETSDVLRNLRSRPEFRQGEW